MYGSNIERLAKETGKYVQGIDNPVDAVLHAGAAGVHVVTGTIDAVTGDIVRVIQGQESRVDLKPYDGHLSRLRLDGSETVQSISNVFHGKYLSALTLPIIAFKAIGDAAADGADLIAGVDHKA